VPVEGCTVLGDEATVPLRRPPTAASAWRQCVVARHVAWALHALRQHREQAVAESDTARRAVQRVQPEAGRTPEHGAPRARG